MESNLIKPYRLLADNTNFEHEKKDNIRETFFLVSDYMKSVGGQGMCHLMSSVFYVLLREQDIICELCIGEAQDDLYTFDHSWITINGKIFDIAIQSTLIGKRNPPIYADNDLGSELTTTRKYGIIAKGLDSQARKVIDTPFSDYLTGAPGKQWKVIKQIGRKLGLRLEIEPLKDKYKETKRVYVK
ncbi:hypothetical protein [Cytobacillus kochii]|uniref:hypothetical protein n=1 Tax=Cytobacillus kochii TaxID=859143 RepID=UPI0024814E1C|nr:hypothetical protein [Cytobacillus kochii]